MRRCICLALTSSALVVMTASAQQPTFERFGVSDGLSSEYIFRIVQDRTGFLWFGTDKGLVRYDGSQFDVYTSADGLPGNLVYDIHEDPTGRIWIATFEKGVGYLPDNKATTILPFEPIRGTVHAVTTDSWGRVYFRTATELGVIEQGAVRILASFGTTSQYSRFVTLEDGRILTATHRELLVVQPSPTDVELARQAVAYDPNFKPPPIPPYGTVVPFVDGDGGLWLSVVNDEKSSILRGRSPESATAVFDYPGRTTSFVFHEGVLAIGTRNGMGFVDTPGDYRAVDQLEGILINDLCVDYEGSVWVATQGGGVLRVTSRNTTDLSGGFETGGNYSFLWSDGRRVFASSDRRLLVHEENETSSVAEMVVGLRGMTESRDGGYDWGIRSNVITGVRSQMFDSRALHPVTPIPDWTSDLYRNGDSLWAATYGHGVALITGTEVARQFTVDDGLASNLVERIAATSYGIWFLTYGTGVSVIRDDVVSTLTTNNGLASNAVFAVFEDSRGTTWLGTDRGVVAINKGATLDVTAVYTATDLLIGEPVVQIFERPTPDGVSLLAVGRRYLYEFAETDFRRVGSAILRPNPTAIVNRAVYLASQDRLYVATTKGFYAIDLPAELPYLPPPKVAIRDVLVGQVAPSDQFDRDVRLSYRDDDVSVGLSALSFVGGRDARIEYRVGENPWSAATSSRTVSLLDLPDGDHVISVRAVNVDGTHSTHPASVVLRVSPPFWRSIWFRVLAALTTIAACVAAGRQLFTRQLRRHARELEVSDRILRERSRISRDLHDTVGAGIANIISGVELASLSAGADGSADLRGNLASLEDDARFTMRQLRETIWTLRAETVSVGDFVAQVEAFVQRQTRYGGPAAGPIATGGDLDATLSPQQALGLFRIVQEAVNNAVKHSGAATITLAVHVTHDLRVRIVDDGVFGSASAGGPLSGTGLATMRERAEDLGGVLRLDYGVGQNTTVDVRVPIDLPRNGRLP